MLSVLFMLKNDLQIPSKDGKIALLEKIYAVYLVRSLTILIKFWGGIVLHSLPVVYSFYENILGISGHKIKNEYKKVIQILKDFLNTNLL